MKPRIMMIGSAVVAVVCAVLILFQAFSFLLIGANGGRIIVIDDNNRQEIEQLVSCNIGEDESLPDMYGAQSIEWQQLMHKDQFVINYENKDSTHFYITARYENPLIEYIKKGGKVLYFESEAFVIDLVKISFFAVLLIAATVVFIKNKKRFI